MRYLIATYITKFWDFVDTRGVVRRIVLGVTMWMTFWISYRMTEFAFAALAANKLSEGNIILAITAISAPIAGLGGYVYKVYLDSRTT
jgi:hypothetical protein